MRAFRKKIIVTLGQKYDKISVSFDTNTLKEWYVPKLCHNESLLVLLTTIHTTNKRFHSRVSLIVVNTENLTFF